ncbi:MAG: hypothetical protein ACI84C_001326 [Flavobacteriales bacterium]|jgi:hypothetical protein
MIKMATIYKPIVLFIAIAISAFAYADTEVYSKEFNKSYSVNSNVTFELNASFAEAKIETWDLNMIEIYVKVEVESKSEEKANQIFDKIDVKIIESSNQIELKTDVDVNSNGDDWSITILVKMPKTADLDASLTFGSLKLQDIMGKCQIDLSYGELEASSLLHAENDVKVAFGDSEIEKLGGGEIKVEFGNLEINRITGDADLSCNYGDLEIDHISSACKNLKIQIDFGSASIELDAGANYEIDAYASFGDISLPNGAKKSSEKEDFTSKSVKARIGSGSSPGLITARCSFGDADIDID